MENERRIQTSLLCLRIGVFIVMFFWTLDKFIQPGHSARIFENFYLIGGMGEGMIKLIGVIQMLIVLGFLAGLFKTATYALVLAMHTISTLASWKQYLAPFDHLLFFAAWPMLAACIALFLLRDRDTLFCMDAWRAKKKVAGSQSQA